MFVHGFVTEIDDEILELIFLEFSTRSDLTIQDDFHRRQHPRSIHSNALVPHSLWHSTQEVHAEGTKRFTNYLNLLHYHLPTMEVRPSQDKLKRSSNGGRGNHWLLASL